MAIEFPCSRCGRQLRTSEENVGREAKCPECGSLTVIPAVSGGMQPQTPQFATAPSNNPFASPVIGGQYAQQPFMATAPGEIVATQAGFTDAFGATWDIFKANLGKCLVFGLLTIGLSIVYIILVAIVGMATGLDFRQQPSIAQTLLIQVIALVPMAWLLLGVIRFFLEMARGQEAPFGLVFSGAPNFGSGLAVYAVLAVLNFLVGLPQYFLDGGMPLQLLLILLNLGVYTFFSQALALVADKNMGASDALSTSLAVMRGNKLTLFFQILVLIVGEGIFIIVTILIGLLAAIPFMWLFQQVVYLLVTGQDIAGRPRVSQDMR
jgi:DNA-directed RNA polymerase subunit RPC12/RpoP